MLRFLLGVWDFQMPKCWGLNFFLKFLQNLPPPSVLHLTTTPLFEGFSVAHVIQRNDIFPASLGCI